MSTSRSAVSRRFVAATETAPADLLATDLSTLDVVEGCASAGWTSPAGSWP